MTQDGARRLAPCLLIRSSTRYVARAADHARAEGRTYEPASAPLERVRAERVVTAKPARRRKG